MDAICVLNDVNGVNKGIVWMTYLFGEGVHFLVKLWDVPPGKHGFHVHRSGDLSQGPHSLCDHYSSPGKTHGNLNEPGAHNGDLGNLMVKEDGMCESSFMARYVSLRGEDSILGRSLVVHTKEDDLGRGSFPDSKTTGHSGDRLLYGIIGVNGECKKTENARQQDSVEGCSVC